MSRLFQSTRCVPCPWCRVHHMYSIRARSQRLQPSVLGKLMCTGVFSCSAWCVMSASRLCSVTSTLRCSRCRTMLWDTVLGKPDMVCLKCPLHLHTQHRVAGTCARVPCTSVSAHLHALAQIAIQPLRSLCDGFRLIMTAVGAWDDLVSKHQNVLRAALRCQPCSGGLTYHCGNIPNF
jgi:hypothetical protein